jgi:hypothetical protein
MLCFSEAGEKVERSSGKDEDFLSLFYFGKFLLLRIWIMDFV